ncbi:amidohydrolase family protein [Mesorhizobium sp. CA8]|uniref:amidohydrolase family protein n=1 Tax=unclassified Mesorhizobium TaxID=325217 RepID=UPI001CCD9A32|nr:MULTISPECIES: amidohydrolase family protein [unclassified Mesorhizobium]MBZ9761755.1 amidohydrolase family protein [Mesorhizobium sp. CA8]MBZ9820492.1 amidohydrolase family protein [Mesorhizobium sp. CA4]
MSVLTEETRGERQVCDLVVHDAVLLTADATDRVIADGGMAVRDGAIVAVGPTREILSRYNSRQLLDAGGGIVHPGFIDAHVHISQYTSRSVLSSMVGTGITMGDWKSALTEQDEYASAALAAVDYLKSGHTGFVDPGTIFTPDAVAAVADELGIRVWLTDPYVADAGGELKKHFPELVSESFLALWPKDRDDAFRRLGSQLFRNKHPNSLVRAFVGLYGEGTDSEELFRAAFKLAREHGVQLQEHLGYAPLPYRQRESALGSSLMQHMSNEGLLANHVTFVHMNAVHPSDVPLLAAHGVGIVWCPYGQLQMLGRGGAEGRMVELHRAGVRVGVASDIPRAGHFSALGTLATVAAAATGLPGSGPEILRMRTVGAAATVGAASELGSLEPGKRADFVVRRPDVSENLGCDPALEFAVIADASTIASVFVEGKCVVKHGEVLNADAPAVVARAHQSVRGLAARLNLPRP